MGKSIQHFLLPQVHPVSIGGGKSEQCKDYLLLPCRKAELIPVTPVTKHKQLLSATAFLQGSCPFGVSKMSFQEKKKIPNQSHLTTVWVKHCSCSFHPVHQKPQQILGHHPFVPCRRWPIVTAEMEPNRGNKPQNPIKLPRDEVLKKNSTVKPVECYQLGVY